MSKNIDCIAFHEAGHAVASILTGTSFRYVTIKEDSEKNEYGKRSLGHIMYENPRSKEEWDQISILNPNEFDVFFKDDFVGLAGLIAERLYKGKISWKGSKEDLRQFFGISLYKLPDCLGEKYLSFLLEYTFQVLNTKQNWSNIVAVALALIDKETLSYDQVREIIGKDNEDPVVK